MVPTLVGSEHYSFCSIRSKSVLRNPTLRMWHCLRFVLVGTTTGPQLGGRRRVLCLYGAGWVGGGGVGGWGVEGGEGAAGVPF